MPVTSVTDLVNLLAARRQASILHDRRTGMPYSWSNWLRTRASKAISLFAHGDVTTVAAARPAPASAGVPRALPLWRVIVAMFWHGGDPPPRDQRGLRWFAGFCSAALHILFALLLLWVALVRSNAPEQDAEQGERVQVEYIGRGTPQEEGGGSPDAAAPAESGAATAARGEAAAPTPASQSAAAPAAEAAQAAEESVAAADAIEAEADAMPVDASKAVPEASTVQPLVVTETTQPTTDFVVPPARIETPAPRPQEVQVHERTVATTLDRPLVQPVMRPPTDVQPRLREPEMQVRERQVEVAAEQQVRLAQPHVRSTDVPVRMPDMAVRERQVETASQQTVAMAVVKQRTTEVGVQAPAMAVRERAVPGVPDKNAAAVPSTAAMQATGDKAAAADSREAGTAGQSAAVNNTPRPGSSAGAGPKPVDRSGGWATPVRGDDWGDSKRQVAGGTAGQADKGRGLFNADGSVRLAGSDGVVQDAKRGAPGGDADTWSRERIAESGTWLKRPPYEFTPTSFDKYWVPNESLLAEWVRKGIKDIKIPIPGTNTSISCVVSMLQFGGGCSLSNPNMQEQPAEARPPPDIPFKKELQEDNGSR